MCAAYEISRKQFVEWLRRDFFVLRLLQQCSLSYSTFFFSRFGNHNYCSSLKKSIAKKTLFYLLVFFCQLFVLCVRIFICSKKKSYLGMFIYYSNSFWWNSSKIFIYWSKIQWKGKLKIKLIIKCRFEYV